MRILQVISSFGLGGAESVAIELSRHFAAGHDVRVLAIRRPNPSELAFADQRKQDLTAAHVRWSEGRAGSQRTSPVFAPFEIAQAVTDFRPDIVHSHTDGPDFCVALARRLKPFVVARTIHNTQLWPTRRQMGRFAESAFDGDMVVAINTPTLEAYQTLRKNFGLRVSNHASVISNGVRAMAESEYASREDLCRIFGGDAARKQVGFIGRLDSQKGFDLLLGALGKLSPEAAAKIDVHVLGDGALREVAAVAAGKGLIRWHGPRSDARRWLRAFDLVVMPSRFEGQPLLAMEAAMAGAQMLVTDAPGLREVFPHDWALVVPAGDGEALRTELEKAATGKLPVAHLPSDWTRRFEAETMAAAYLEAYERYLAAVRNLRPGEASKRREPTV